jgi:hypothetical protein
VTRRRPIVALIVAATVAALIRAPGSRADEDEEKAITSYAAHVSRNAAGQVFITLRPAAQKESGLGVETLKPVVRRIEIEAYGFVLDPAPLSKLNSDLIGARAVLDASTAQYQRTRHLYAEHRNASLRDLQSAQAAYLTDKARLEALEQQLRDEWGREIAQIPAPNRAALVRALIDRDEAIARVTVPVGQALDDAPAKAEIVVLGHQDHPLAARAVYYAPTVNPRVQGQAFLLLAGTKHFPVGPGTAVAAYLPTSRRGEQGVMVPRSAVVRYAGKEWVYQELGANRFTRREIVPAQSTTAGYFVTQNLGPGMRVVVTGAQTLLSEELKAQIQPAD